MIFGLKRFDVSKSACSLPFNVSHEFGVIHLRCLLDGYEKVGRDYVDGGVKRSQRLDHVFFHSAEVADAVVFNSPMGERVPIDATGGES